MRICRVYDREKRISRFGQLSPASIATPSGSAPPLLLYSPEATLRDILLSSGHDSNRRESIPHPINASGRYSLLPPIPAPSKILCVGLNYAAHVREFNAAVDRPPPPPETPTIFAKLPSSVVAAGEPIVWNASETNELDYEGELAVVIGRTCWKVSKEDAMDHVAGFTLANDVTARDWQRGGGNGQWTRGKGGDTFCPLGPWLLTPEEMGVSAKGRSGSKTRSDSERGTFGECILSATLNGDLVQRAQLGDMIFNVSTVLEHLSGFCTLYPGDVVLTGTPEGVGMGRGRFLRHGDRVVVRLEVPWSGLVMELENVCEEVDSAKGREQWERRQQGLGTGVEVEDWF